MTQAPPNARAPTPRLSVTPFLFSTRRLLTSREATGKDATGELASPEGKGLGQDAGLVLLIGLGADAGVPVFPALARPARHAQVLHQGGGSQQRSSVGELRAPA